MSCKRKEWKICWLLTVLGAADKFPSSTWSSQEQADLSPMPPSLSHSQRGNRLFPKLYLTRRANPRAFQFFLKPFSRTTPCETQGPLWHILDPTVLPTATRRLNWPRGLSPSAQRVLQEHLLTMSHITSPRCQDLPQKSCKATHFPKRQSAGEAPLPRPHPQVTRVFTSVFCATWVGFIYKIKILTLINRKNKNPAIPSNFSCS